MMNQDGFTSVEMGQPVSEMIAMHGKPMHIYSKGYDSQIYEYVERLSIGTNVVQQRRYFIVVSNDRVVGKYMKFDNPPPFQTIYTNDPFPNY
jgi:hypothetical protein